MGDVYGTVLPWIQPANTCKASELTLKAIPAALMGSINISRQSICNDKLLNLAQTGRKKWIYLQWSFVARSWSFFYDTNIILKLEELR